MSALVGLLQLDGTPVAPDRLDAMCAAVAYRGPDGTAATIVAGCGLGALSLHTHPTNRMPGLARSSDERFAIALDGVLDNRAELRQALFTSNAHHLSDADLILAAYQRWGADAPRRLLGDFAFAIWDSLERRLFLARDPVGIRLLYYARHGRHVAFATTIPAVLAGLGTRPALNEAVVAEFLQHRYDRSVHETFYAGLMRLPQGCTLTIDSDGHTILRRYWHFGEEPAPTRDEEHIERFQSAFEDAIRSRLEGADPVGLMLSGGLDSSSIALIAQKVLQQETASTLPTVRSYSLVYEHFSSLDERSFLEAVLARCPNIIPTRIPGDHLQALAESGDTADEFPLDEPDIWPLRIQTTSLLRPAIDQGCRRILSGYGGDQILGFGYQNGLVFREMGPRHWTSELRYFRRFMFNDERLVRALGAAFLPPSLLRPIRPLLHHLRPTRTSVLRRTWVQRVEETAPPPFRLEPPAHLPESARQALSAVQHGWFSTCLANNDRMAAYMGVEFRDPFLDRRVIEALTTIPWHLRYQQGRIKLILRRALHDRFPPALLARTVAATSTDMIDNGLMSAQREKVVSLIERTLSVQRAWLDADRYRQEWHAYWQGQRPNHWPLMTPLYVTTWADANGIQLS